MKAGAKDFIVKDFGADFSDILNLSLSRVYTELSLIEERQKLRKETEALRVAIENGNYGFALVDVNGDILYANSAFKSFSSKCNATGNSVLTLFSDVVAKHQELTESVKRCLETLDAGAVWHTEVSFVGEDNSAFDFSLTTVTDKSVAACVLWVRDVSAMKRREKFQREILSTTSHDLKGPLGAITLSAELIEDQAEPDSRIHEIALRIGSAAQGAINLIEEFLSARRLQEGNFIMKPVQTTLNDVLKGVADNYEAIANAKGIQFKVEGEEDVPAFVDPLGVSRVVGNLLNNAFKFTPKGGEVNVKFAKKDDGGCLVDVSDTGAGIEPSEVGQIFQRFTRLERHSSIAGTGLGLFVVKNIVNAHGGSIEVKSTLGHGTSFRIEFPKNPPLNEHGELISLEFA